MKNTKIIGETVKESVQETMKKEREIIHQKFMDCLTNNEYKVSMCLDIIEEAKNVKPVTK